MQKSQNINSVITEIFKYWKEQWNFILRSNPKLICASLNIKPNINLPQPGIAGIKLSKKSTAAINNYLKKRK